MSIMLVVGFVCLELYESKVREEYDAHNYVLKEMVDDQHEAFRSFINVPMNNCEISKVEKEELNQLKSDVKIFRKRKLEYNLESKDVLKQLFKKYGMESELRWKGNIISIISEKYFYNRIDSIVNVLDNEINERAIQKRNNNVKIIIKERDETYKVGELHKLNFLAVLKNNYDMEKWVSTYKITGPEVPFDNFPLEFSYRPDSITFFLKDTNRVNPKPTVYREKYILNEELLP